MEGELYGKDIERDGGESASPMVFEKGEVGSR